MLTDYPQYAEHFPAVQGVKPSDFGSNAYIRDQQGPKTGKAVADMISKLDDADAMNAACHGLVHAPQHIKINLKTEDYGNAFTALVKTFERVLGAEFKESDKAAWTKFATVALELIAKQY